ncbi:UBA/TS-N domain containing protein [Metarhizium album ARSEF 1941]|uniref:UBA/TS-N domain containing protein n=1 Tax=Metarhizium album (strain ARSEF 1941) TaxID=1081103 RepID=A0A0B2WDF4_METAS|nr:UBA/TS-N domain containing protein [Metarhizium album ARSEF 1941]KHN93881.1 UBA/TS-N domain containing protein [Metarhizium album ARSEF 1941]
MPSDLEALTEMGFDKARAEIAVKKSGGLQGALQWLEDNQDKSLDEIRAEEAGKAGEDGEDGEDDAETKAEIAELETGQARSLICNECGKKFRNHDLATFHATKTEHTDFSESTEELAPLTEEEKKAKLEQLRERLKAKRAAQSVQDKEDAKRNERIRQKSTKESQDLKEELARKEQIKEAARKRQEKQDDIEAKKRIKARIEADKAERQRKAEEARAAREGRAPDAAASAPAAAPPKPKPDHNTARLRLQTPSGNLMKTLPAETTLFELAQMVQGETGLAVTSFSTTFPRHTFTGDLDMSKTLKEAGFVPSSVLIVQ